MRFTRTQTVLLLLAAFLPASAFGAAGRRAKKPKKDTDSTGLDDYLSRARAFNLPAPETVGSLWVGSGPLADLGQDYKARNPGDLLVIHLTDNFTAATAGENNQSRAFSAQSQVTGFFGAIGARNRLQNLFGANSANSLDGKGSSTMSSSVSLDLAAHVIEVLPNKMLVVQATRDITVGNDRQTVYIRGLVRPGDIALDNSILSSSISDLEVEIKGKGAVAEASRQPNVVIRWLLKLLTF
ncbi:MAG TPA: flagellar basal body L-ring protein FlgH [Terriglobales bacterium]|nr:flagellar basal body L-ring protein FlgH [Terriglobales bacterium]